MKDKSQDKPLVGLHPLDTLVSGAGGVLDLIAADGEVLAQIHVPPGRHRASYYTDLCQAGEVLQISEGLASFPPRSRCAVTVYPEHVNRASDANPDWQPTYASEMERQLRVRLIRKRQESTRTERRAAAQASLEASRAAAEQALVDAKSKADADAAAEKAEREAAADLIAQAMAKATAVVE